MRIPLRKTSDPQADDRELEQVAGITPADHQFTSASPAAIDRMERQILGPAWYRPRKKPDENS